MKLKILIKFYYFGEELNGRLDRFILHSACKPYEDTSLRVEELIEDKRVLCNLMVYLRSVFAKLNARDEVALKKYANLKVGLGKLEAADRREIKRAVTKFSRKLIYYDGHAGEVEVLRKYRCIF